MKFKVEPKDFLLFCIYCGLLLYLCAIAVLNLSSLAQEGRFYGLLPFKAFTGAYLPVTLILFIGALVAIFSSVSSYIFKKDKGSHGVGLIFKGKSSDGYSKWANEKDIKGEENVVKVNPLSDTLDAAGINLWAVLVLPIAPWVKPVPPIFSGIEPSSFLIFTQLPTELLGLHILSNTRCELVSLYI